MGRSTSATEPEALVGMALLVLGTAVAYWALQHPRWSVLAAALAGLGVGAWTFTNLPYEGLVLAAVDDDHGVTAADLLSLPAVVLVMHLSWRAARR